MPAQDLYHDLVKEALRKDGWRVTHNPFRLRVPRHLRQAAPGSPEPGVEAFLLGAEQDERKIAVAVKSFVGIESGMIEQAVETLAYSRALLCAMDLDRVLYLAVRRATYEAFYDGTVEPQLVSKLEAPLLVFEPRTGAIVAWLPRQHETSQHASG